MAKVRRVLDTRLDRLIKGYVVDRSCEDCLAINYCLKQRAQKLRDSKCDALIKDYVVGHTIIGDKS